MSDTASAADTTPPSDRSLFSRLRLVLVAVVVLAAAGGGAYYYKFVMHKAPQGAKALKKEPPLPFYLAVKPFVVSMGGGGNGVTHFVQIGVNLTLSGASAGNLVTALMPEVQDTLRLAALSFKVGDITTPAGVDKMRQRMTVDLNRMLLQRLGAQRITQINNGDKDLVKHIYFSQLIIE
jgi:flagellar FliL protein